MKLKEFKEIIDTASEFADGCDCKVLVNTGKAYHEIRAVNQYSILPDVIIEVGEKVDDE